MNIFAVLGCILLVSSTCLAAYEDARCKCVCVDRMGVYNGTKPTRKIFVKAIAAEKCSCLLMLDKEAASLCPYCDCKYQVRNTTTIKVVVCLILGIISALTLYMIFLLLLEPLLSARRAGRKLINLGSSPNQPSTDANNTESSTSGARFSQSDSQGSWLNTVGASASHQPGTGDLAVSWTKPRVSSEQLLNIEKLPIGTAHPISQLKHRMAQPGLLINSVVSGPGRTSRTLSTARANPATAGVSTMVRNVRYQQQRWKGNVEAQRARVFSEHTLLN